jgi:hypothetical protein
MLRSLAIAVAAITLAGCAGLEPAGRNAARPEAPVALPPPPAEAAPAPQPPPAPSEPTQPTPAAPVAAPSVAAPPPPPPAADRADITVTAPTERQVPAPRGDPRSVAEQREDIQNWDHCVMQVQAAYENDPMRVALESPEDVCSRQLGMANRNAVPQSRLTPQRR